MTEPVIAEYVMHTRGATTGAVTGRHRSWAVGDTIDAPRGEFDHLPAMHYSTRDMQPASAPRYEVREGKAGWWKVVDTRTGDPVEGESERTEDEALANAQRLNDAE